MLGNEKGERFFVVFYSLRMRDKTSNASVTIITYDESHFSNAQAIDALFPTSKERGFKREDIAMTGFNELSEDDFNQFNK
jgi:hypothetical protein